MKKMCEIFCITIVAIILSGCARSAQSEDEVYVDDTIKTGEKFTIDTYDITFQLTPEQQANFAYADYDIVCSVKGVGVLEDDKDPRLDEMYMFMYRGKNVELDANGVLHGYYGKMAPYMYNETTQSYTGIPLIVIEDEEQVDYEIRYICQAVLSNYNIEKISRWKTESVDMQIVVNKQYPKGHIRKVVLDTDDEEKKSKEKLLDLDDYGSLEIVSGGRYFTRGGNGEMLNFFEWEHSNKALGIALDLTENYHLEMKPLENPEHYYCIFYIEDVDGNVTYSELIPIQQ